MTFYWYELKPSLHEGTVKGHFIQSDIQNDATLDWIMTIISHMLPIPVPRE